MMDHPTTMEGAVILCNANANRPKINVFTAAAAPINDDLNHFLSGLLRLVVFLCASHVSA